MQNLKRDPKPLTYRLDLTAVIHTLAKSQDLRQTMAKRKAIRVMVSK